MEITVDKLLQGKPTMIKEKSYLPTKDYVNPFFDQMSKFTDKFIINVQTPDQITLTNNEEDLTFNRVWIQAVMPDKYCIDNHDEVYGMVYGLDVRQPVYKIYRGALNRACTNLCVFDPQWIQVNELKPGENFNYSIQRMMELTSNMEIMLRKMKNTYLPSGDEDKHRQLGYMIEKAMLEEYQTIGGKVKIATSTVIKAYQDVYQDTSSKYYVGNNESSVFNYYNAFTELIKEDKKDLMNKFEKTMLIGSLFNLVD